MAIKLGRGTLLHGKGEWGGRRAKSVASSVPIEGVIDHWMGTRTWPRGIGDHSTCLSVLRGAQNFHMDGRGWTDLAYNFVVCPHGHAFEGRGFARNGANGTAHWNKHTYTILWLVGQGDVVSDRQRADMARAAADVYDWCRFAGGAAAKRRGHRDVRSTACPGDMIIWISHNNWSPPVAAQGPPATVAANGIPAGASLGRGGFIRSPNGTVTLNHQSDGNVVIYRSGQAVWQTNTPRASSKALVVQGDGNVVLYDNTNRPLWHANTGGNSVKGLVIQDDANAVLYGTGGNPVWSATYG